MKEYIVQAIAQETIDSFDAHNAPELIRCKDCDYVCLCDSTEMFPDIPVYAKCTLTDEVHEPDWFCADGEKAAK